MVQTFKDRCHSKAKCFSSQGFSGINRFKQANDIKNTLIATSLSYVDFYKPKYFLLENVRGMLSFRLGGAQAGTNRIQGGIKMGVVKFIIRALTTMGYEHDAAASKRH
jgi:DNA (cytosine-5)-methyltransferase 1